MLEIIHTFSLELPLSVVTVLLVFHDLLCVRTETCPHLLEGSKPRTPQIEPLVNQKTADYLLLQIL